MCKYNLKGNHGNKLFPILNVEFNFSLQRNSNFWPLQFQRKLFEFDISQVPPKEASFPRAPAGT
jgi:hypothetical protein